MFGCIVHEGGRIWDVKDDGIKNKGKFHLLPIIIETKSISAIVSIATTFATWQEKPL